MKKWIISLLAHQGIYVSSLKIAFFVVFFAFLAGSFPVQRVEAIAPSCTSVGVSSVEITPKSFASEEVDVVTVKIDATNLKNGEYRIRAFSNTQIADLERVGGWDVKRLDNSEWQTKSDGTTIMTFELDGNAVKQVWGELGSTDQRVIYLDDKAFLNLDKRHCKLGVYEVHDQAYTAPNGCTLTVWQDAPPSADGPSCYYPSSCMDSNKRINIKVAGIETNGEKYDGRVTLVVGEEGWFEGQKDMSEHTGTPGEVTFSLNPDNNESTTYFIDSFEISQFGTNPTIENCKFPGGAMMVEASCSTDSCSTTLETVSSSFSSQPYKLCEQINDIDLKTECIDCAGAETGKAAGIWTAVGCIPTESDAIVRVVMKIGLGMGGGVALIMILGAAFMLSTSQGDPKRTNDAKDMLSSAIIGLLFIIFSITMLQFIGVSILNIPGFGT